MKRVLVAGATGYLGHYVVKEFKKQGYWVRALARSADRLEDLRGQDIQNSNLVAKRDIGDAETFHIGKDLWSSGILYDGAGHGFGCAHLREPSFEGFLPGKLWGSRGCRARKTTTDLEKIEKAGRQTHGQQQ